MGGARVLSSNRLFGTSGIKLFNENSLGYSQGQEAETETLLDKGVQTVEGVLERLTV